MAKDDRVGVQVAAPADQVSSFVFDDGAQYSVDPKTGKTTACVRTADQADAVGPPSAPAADPEPAPVVEPAPAS